MSGLVRTRVISAWAALAALAAVASLFIGPFGPRRATLPVNPLVSVGGMALTMLLIALALVLLLRRPDNRVGWMFGGLATFFALSGWLDNYAKVSYQAGAPPLPGAVAVAWVNAWAPMAWWALIAFVLLLFPTGRLPSRRWRPVAWITLTAYAVTLVGMMIKPGRLIEQGPMNPVGWSAAAPVTDAIGALMWPVSTLLLATAALSLVVRYRRARDVERHQLKWLALSGLLIVSGGLVYPLTVALSAGDGPWLAVTGLLYGGGLISVPIFATVAILRYRLYAIDRIISRTLSYALLSGLLAALYAATVFTLSSLVASFGGDTAVTVAAATLAVAAAFRPLRRRVQAVVDHRFDRARYDAQLTVRAFADRLRDRVDVEEVSQDLLTTAAGVVQPRTAHLWLR